MYTRHENVWRNVAKEIEGNFKKKYEYNYEIIHDYRFWRIKVNIDTVTGNNDEDEYYTVVKAYYLNKDHLFFDLRVKKGFNLFTKKLPHSIYGLKTKQRNKVVRFWDDTKMMEILNKQHKWHFNLTIKDKNKYSPKFPKDVDVIESRVKGINENSTDMINQIRLYEAILDRLLETGYAHTDVG